MQTEKLFKELNKCTLCPRNCNANRNAGAKGVCGVDTGLYVARAALHMWEEPCISGSEGSGAVFFSGCNMHCVFCQNKDISNGAAGKEITIERLAKIFTELQEKNANNINLVTPTHYTCHIIEAVKKAREEGLVIPIIYNTSGYEKPETIALLKDTVDVFLPDFKYMNPETAASFSKAPDYPEVAKKAIEAMVNITGPCEFDNAGKIKKGTIVRVLVLPGKTREAMDIIKWLHETFGDSIYLSIMSQYTPMDTVPDEAAFHELHRPITKREYEKVIDYALSLGIKNAFIQEGSVAKESFIPEFNGEGV